MLERFRRPSPALVISLIALFAALGGAAWAAKAVKKNTVVSKSIKTDAVTRSKIADNAVDSARIQDGSIALADLGAGVQSAVGSGIWMAHASQNNTATQFMVVNGGDNDNTTGLENNFVQVIPSGGPAVVASSLDVRLDAAITAGSRKFTLRSNGNDTGLSCTINIGNSSCSAAANVTLAAGQFTSIKVDNAAGVNPAAADAGTSIRYSSK
jgi:hypothetical protein